MYRVLVVDDNVDMQTMLSRILTDMGFVVDTADSANAALGQLAKQRPDLVITDIRMDGMDGLSLVGLISERDPDIPTVVMTGYASMETAIAAIRTGACDYLVKPFESFDYVRDTVNRALQTTRAARERDELIENLKKQNEELHDLAIRDGLTGLYNQRHISELLAAEFERAVRYHRELSVLFIDVDHFKDYNDRNGHPRGDEALRAIAGILQENTRKSDAVARWGGEEFLVLAPETSPEAAANLAEKLRASVAQHAFPGRESQPAGCVSISVGIANLSGGDSFEKLIARADEALYAAKSAGRNTVKNAA
ncbi:MAG: diguanylate cyclase [Gammaproteobacteria bacterium]|nr:diguanylate cyclase [Gammaproteobacteria bacterium]NNF60658.1 diguanylate cyclase [Gammaproteobacteria bacterium]